VHPEEKIDESEGLDAKGDHHGGGAAGKGESGVSGTDLNQLRKENEDLKALVKELRMRQDKDK
jgi:hypothetical protein